MPTATTERPATPSTPRLSEVARHLVIPDGIVSSVWPRVERRLRTVGVVFDPWQAGFSMAALGCRADGKYAATVGGVVESIPRQVGKTFKDGNLVLGLAAEFPGLRVAWTSHHLRTTTNTFRKMCGLATRPKMRALLAPNGIRKTNGEQEIRFANGSIIMFGARSEGFGRGIDELDILVFDEAQILGLKALEDMVPATNQAKHPHGGLVFLLGTPPRPDDDGEAFSAMRDDALSGESTDRMFVEISADPDAAWDDRDQWRKMNPSYPHRTPEEAMLRMRAMIPSEDAWRREAMGIWDEGQTDPWGVIKRPMWKLRATIDPDPHRAGWLTGPVTLSVETDTDQTRTTIAIAGDRPDGIGTAVVAHHPGTGWALETITEMCLPEDGSRPIAHVVIDEQSHAAPLVAPLEEAGITVTVPKTGAVKTATATLINLFNEGGIEYRESPELERAAAVSKLRKHGEGHVINRWVEGDPSPLIGVNLAVWGHMNQPEPEPAVGYYSARRG